MLGCNKKHDAYSWHKNIQDCMNFFRSSLFFSFYLTKHRSSDFFSICFVSIAVVERKNLVTVHNALTTTLCVYVYVFRFPGTLMLSLLLFHSFIQSLIDSHLVDLFFFTIDTRLSVRMFKLDYIIFQKKRQKKKRKKAEDDNSFSAQETNLLK
jgi:hypothetical protein